LQDTSSSKVPPDAASIRQDSPVYERSLSRCHEVCTKLVINGKHTIDCQNKKKYSYRSQGNIHLLYRCEEGHFSIISFDGHKGVVLFDRNTLMNDLTMFLNEKTKDDRDKKQFDFVMSYAILGYIEDFLSIETT
jgi:hypothetical protein